MACLICDNPCKTHINICDHCHSLFEPRLTRPVLDLTYVDEVYIAYYYQTLIKESILKYKFSNKRYLAKVFAEVLCDFILKERLYKEVNILVPVPLHRKTQKLRGFNQVDLIADIICQNFGLKKDGHNLVKVRHTKEQARLSLDQRKTNLEEAFAIKDPRPFKNQTVLVLDDLITSGSTVDQCSQVLKEAGAKKILALGLASSI